VFDSLIALAALFAGSETGQEANEGAGRPEEHLGAAKK
jgi:hypothetical protein